VSDARRLVDKLWSYCNVLRDDGVGTIEYTEQLTYLLFLKMAHERETRGLKAERIVPAHCSWQRLLDADGDDWRSRTGTSWKTLASSPARWAPSTARPRTGCRTRRSSSGSSWT
jgi:HsdM N-terminal domain